VEVLAVSSVLVLVVLAGMWAYVLVPAFRQRHDRADELRSVDRFSAAMRVLSRRSGGADRRWVVMPAREWGTRGARVAGSGGALSAAERRRRTLGGLLATALVTLLLAVTGGTAWLVLQLLADAALAAALVWSARSAARERARGARPRAARRDVPLAPVWPPARVTPPRAGVPVMTVPLDPVAAVPAARAEPVAPEPAAAGVRVVDLTTPGGWSRTRLVDARAGQGYDDPDDLLDLTGDAGLDALLERRTAAGGW